MIRKLLWATFLVLGLMPLTIMADQPLVVPLWPNGAPGSEGQTSKEVVTQRTEPGLSFSVVSNIHNPTITVFLPPKKKATGAAVIILPGGAHRFLSIDHEGYDVAKWFSERGVASFVLKYRLARSEGSTYKVEVHALQDAQRALRLVRSRAQEWGVDPARVGIMGFSAGGEVAALAATNYDSGSESASDPIERQQSRPDFQVLIYPGTAKDLNVTKDTPPTFLACAYDDRPTMSEYVATLFLTLKKAGVPAELHIYSSGGHGFGIRKGPHPISAWPSRLQEWLADLKFLRKP
jgi:acetyl esterase/lipase